MYTVSELITPERAKALLQTNPRNRKVNKFYVDAITKDILNGKYEETHQSIAIDKNGNLVDGHHRLTGIVNAGVPVRMQVTYDAPNSTKIDIGAKRRQRDQGYMNGLFEKDSIEFIHLTYPLISFMYERSNGQSKERLLGVDEKHELYIQYKPLVDTVIKIATSINKGKGRGSAVLYSMMCAINDGVEPNTISNWFKIVATGDFYVQDDEILLRAGRSVLLFKNFIESVVRRGGTGNARYLNDEIVKKAMSSIYYYNRKNYITKLYGSTYFNEIIVPEDLLLQTNKE